MMGGSNDVDVQSRQHFRINTLCTVTSGDISYFISNAFPLLEYVVAPDDGMCFGLHRTVR
jgi:hypothetical protein